MNIYLIRNECLVLLTENAILTQLSCLLCKAEMQYLLTLQVSLYYILALHRRIAYFVKAYHSREIH